MSRQPGITLIELLIVLALAGLVVMLAVPALANLALDARMTDQVNRFVHSMHVALGESEKRGLEVAVCRSSNGRQCNPKVSWQAGWIVFVNRDQDDPPVVDPGERILQVTGPFAGGTIAANRQAFVFRPFGRRSVNGTLVFCDRRGKTSARTVVVSYTGRPRATVASHNNPVIC